MIAIINTGCANINSVRFAFERLGVAVEIISEPANLRNLNVLITGCSHAEVAMKRLITTVKVPLQTTKPLTRYLFRHAINV